MKLPSSPPLSVDLIDQLTDKIAVETGLSFVNTKRADLIRALHRMAAAKGWQQSADCVDWLLTSPWSPAKTALCAQHLTIGETYFFREPRAFRLVQDYARAKLATEGAANARLRLWSAGCCTGEEPYSMAMALQQAVPEMDAAQISILGTDINSRFLESARAGIYRQWSFRNPEAAMHESHFSRDSGGQYHLNDTIRQQVRFAELNLAAPVYPSMATDTQQIDIIFCRNVLMYFSREQARQVIARFRQCLVNGGWLIVNPSEASSELFAGFTGVYHPDAIYFQKSDAAPSLAGARHRPAKALAGKYPEAVTSGIALAASCGLQPPIARKPATAAGIRNGAAAVLLQQRAFAKPLQPVQSVLAHQPQPPPAASASDYHARAVTAIEAGDASGALQNLRHVLYLQPDSIIARYLMGIVRATQSKHEEAARQFEIAKRLLAPLHDHEIVPESEGLSAANLRESVRAFLQKGRV